MSSIRAVCLGLLGLVLAANATGHDHTKKQFELQRALAVAQAKAQSEPAPREDADEKTCRLTIELRLDDAPQPIAGLVRITNLATGKAIAFADEIQREANWCAVTSPATLVVPQGKLKVEALYGLESELVSREIDLTAQEKHLLTVDLQRFYKPADRKLVGGNTHLHLMKLTHAEAVRYLETVPRADGLDLVFLSHLKRVPEDVDYISNLFTDGDLGRLSKGGVLFGNGEEHRHNFGPGAEGYGHVMFLNLQRLVEPVSIGPGIMKSGTDGRPLRRGIDEARSQAATVIWCHNQFGHEDLPNWIAGVLDAQNIYDGNPHGTYSDTYYRYLNLGLKVPFSTGTDWFIYDFSRVYLPLEGELTARRWLLELAHGRSYITNGPFLELTAGQHKIGDSIAAKAGDELPITARALGRSDFRGLELIHNGKVIEHVHGDKQNGHFEAELQFTLKIDEPGWIAVRIPLEAGQNEFGKPHFAHTSPIYIELAGRRIFRPEVARGLIADMEKSIEAIKAEGKFADAAEEEAVLSVYREGIAVMQQRLSQASTGQ
ncbi:MAG TPA: CehA/McbA family metallohydrolase [Pirellulaceae bacterium]|nr:CehA/McbA family metallohydrolase [Pirellulaceae bacterium]